MTKAIRTRKSISSQSLIVRSRPGNRQQGQLIFQGRVIRCALGRSGSGIGKCEGDGKTPLGRMKLLSVKYRRDRWFIGSVAFKAKPISGNDGWCDAVGDRNYNRSVTLPYPASHEEMMRKDYLYDLVIVMDYNISRRLTRGGSAIFFHLAREDYGPTEGCVAISRRDMHWLLRHLKRGTSMMVV